MHSQQQLPGPQGPTAQQPSDSSWQPPNGPIQQPPGGGWQSPPGGPYPQPPARKRRRGLKITLGIIGGTSGTGSGLLLGVLGLAIPVFLLKTRERKIAEDVLRQEIEADAYDRRALDNPR